MGVVYTTIRPRILRVVPLDGSAAEVVVADTVPRSVVSTPVAHQHPLSGG